MLTESDLAYVAREMKARCGIAISRDMGGFVETRLTPLARREGFAAVSEFLSTARTRQSEAMWTAIADALMQSESRFFRDRDAFINLREKVLPDLFARKRARLRVLSAGCGGGQEPYSLAMMMEDMRDQGLPGADILAVDLSDRLLEKARSGLYTQFEVQRGLPIRSLIKHFEKAGELWRISDRLRAGVRFQQHNLTQACDTLGQFDLILCRHVLSNFDPAHRKATLERLAIAAAPGAVLMLSPAEDYRGESEAFIPGEAGLATRNPEWKQAA